MTNYTTALLDALCADIALTDLGAVWHPETPYDDDEFGISQQVLPETPGQVISVGNYAESEIATYRRDQESVVTFVQVRFRVDTLDTGRDAQDVLRDRYHRRRRVLNPLEAEPIVVTGRQLSRGYIGEGENGRYLFTQNFSFQGLRERTP